MKVKDYLIKLCKHVGLTEDQFSVEVEEADETISAKVALPESESGLFIGFRGETLQAITRIIRVSFFNQLENKIFKLNINDYREQHEEQMKERAVGVARQVLETGETYTFPYLPAHDRFLIHTILSDHEELGALTSKSDGEGRSRYLTICLKGKDEPEGKDE